MNSDRINDTIVIIFSKDRAMQLDLALKSFYYCNYDVWMPQIVILYTTSNKLHEKTYNTLIKEHDNISFVREQSFKNDLVNILKQNKKYVLFMTDDTIWSNYFSLDESIQELEKHKDVLGFSFRLGENTDYCYPLSEGQKIPMLRIVKDRFDYDELNTDYTFNIVKWFWPAGQHDFSYALELSSSLYRIKDIFDILVNTRYNHPNELEAALYYNLRDFAQSHPYMLCYSLSVAFANPINRVQNVASGNRFGNLYARTANELAELFNDGYRCESLDYLGIITRAAHREVKLSFFKKDK